MLSRLNTVSSKPGSSFGGSQKHNQILTLDNFTAETKTNESRFTFMEQSRGTEYSHLGTRDRLNYFKSLMRKQPKPVEIVSDLESDAFDRVERKLDEYFNKALGAIGKTDHIV